MVNQIDWVRRAQDNWPLRAINMLLRGCSQVIFQNNPLTGLLFFIAIFVGAWQEGLPQVAFGALLGTAASTFAAALIVSDRDALQAGLYGYNGCLVGAALPTFLAVSPLLWLAIAFCGLVSVIITLSLANMLKIWKMTALTAPFVITTWTLLLASYAFPHLHTIRLPQPAMPSLVISLSEPLTLSQILTSTLQGVSQVFLFSSVTGGVLLLLGLVLSSWWSMVLALVGALLPVMIAGIIGADFAHITRGLYGFSAVLTAVALGCTFNRPRWRALLYAVVGVIFTVLVQGAVNTLLAPLGMPSLTFPFVVVSWLFLLAKPGMTGDRMRLSPRSTPQR